MRITTNISQIITKNTKRLESLKDPDKTTRILAFDTVALVSDRVQQDGKKSDGTLIQSGYSSNYSKRRSNKGLQTSFVDLTFTGDMFADFLPVMVGKDWGAGFVGKKSADVAEYNERRFGKIFTPTESELKTLRTSFGVIVKKLLE